MTHRATIADFLDEGVSGAQPSRLSGKPSGCGQRGWKSSMGFPDGSSIRT